MMRKAILVLAAMLLIYSCSSDDTYTTYSRYKANFSYSKVMTAAPLKNALTGPGEFCTITFGTSTLIFKSLTSSHSDPITASTMYYQSFRCMSMDGFIVGMPNQLEMNADELKIVCYDVVCSNCYHDIPIHSILTLQENGFAFCKRCKRNYNLNNLGMSSEGDRPLERYHISYDGANYMAVWN